MPGILYLTVTIATVHTKLTGMKFMAVGDGLYRLKTNFCVFLRAEIPDCSNQTNAGKASTADYQQRNFVKPLWKYLCQFVDRNVLLNRDYDVKSKSKTRII